MQVPIATNTPINIIFKFRWFLDDAKIYPTCARLRHKRRFLPQNFANHQSFTMFATSNKPDSPGATIHQTYPTAVKGHYGSIVSRPV